jgi:hypothetical protein
LYACDGSASIGFSNLRLLDPLELLNSSSMLVIVLVSVVIMRQRRMHKASV